MCEHFAFRGKIKAILITLALTIVFPLSAQTYRLELGDDGIWAIFSGSECVVVGQNADSFLDDSLKIDRIELKYDGRESGYLRVHRLGTEIFYGRFKDFLLSEDIESHGGLTLFPGEQYSLSHGEKKWEINLVANSVGVQQENTKESDTENFGETVIVDDENPDYLKVTTIAMLVAGALCVILILIIIIMAKNKKKAEKKGVEQIFKTYGAALGLPESSWNYKSVLDGIANLQKELESLRQQINDLKKELDELQPKIQPLAPVKGFNIQKNEAGSEDADPCIFADSKKPWGVIGVFDGMGGSGHRIYTHNETQEAHTSAYWASRYVKEVVEKLIEEIDTNGADPLSYVNEDLLHQRIQKKLDEEITHFSTESSAKSKMIRIFPTTVALCIYEIKDDGVHINTYWAGDSRIYMFDREQMSFLTIDDADAPGGDPFSPANSDLPMNNTISQDYPFCINKLETVIPLDANKPFVLLACTDGCFGYYRNPIEFEKMVRTKLEASTDWGEWSDKMQNAIIENGQGDDLSMVGVAIGVVSIDDFKKNMQEGLDKSIFREYEEWEKEGQGKKNVANGEIEEIRVNIRALKDEISKLQQEKDEQEAKVNEMRDEIETLTKPKQSPSEETVENGESSSSESAETKSDNSPIESAEEIPAQTEAPVTDNENSDNNPAEEIPVQTKASEPDATEPQQTKVSEPEAIELEIELANPDDENEEEEEAQKTVENQQESEEKEAKIKELNGKLEDGKRELEEREANLQVKTEELKKWQGDLQKKKDDLEELELKIKEENNDLYKKLNPKIFKPQKEAENDK